MFWREWVLGGLWRVLQIGCQGSMPFVLRAFVVWLGVYYGSADESAAAAPIGYGVGLAFALGTLPMLEMVFAERSMWLNIWTSFRIRTLLVLLVTRKLLRKRSADSPVDVANLVTTDADRVKESAESLHFLWRTPVLVIICMSVLVSMLGWLPALGSLGTIVVLVGLTVVLKQRFAKLKKSVSEKTDARVTLTTDLIRSLENVKSLALETHFEREILEAREKEVALLTRYRILFAFFKSLTIVLAPLALFAALSVYMLQYGDTLTASVVFACLASVNTLQVLDVHPSQ